VKESVVGSQSAIEASLPGLSSDLRRENASKYENKKAVVNKTIYATGQQILLAFISMLDFVIILFFREITTYNNPTLLTGEFSPSKMSVLKCCNATTQKLVNKSNTSYHIIATNLEVLKISSRSVSRSNRTRQTFTPAETIQNKID